MESQSKRLPLSAAGPGPVLLAGPGPGVPPAADLGSGGSEGSAPGLSLLLLQCVHPTAELAGDTVRHTHTRTFTHTLKRANSHTYTCRLIRSLAHTFT